MAEPFGSSTLIHGQTLTAAQVNHLPIVARYARRLGLVELVNRLVPVEMDVEPGIMVLGLVLDTLCGLRHCIIWRVVTSFRFLDPAR